MKITNILKSELNNLTISTVKIGRVYETMVRDSLGNELRCMQTNYKNEAKSNHLLCVAHYASRRNCIHAI